MHTFIDEAGAFLPHQPRSRASAAIARCKSDALPSRQRNARIEVFENGNWLTLAQFYDPKAEVRLAH
jgi:hypothetical protein